MLVGRPKEDFCLSLKGNLERHLEFLALQRAWVCPAMLALDVAWLLYIHLQ